MATKLKFKPTQEELKAKFRYIETGQYAGRLVPINIKKSAEDFYMENLDKATTVMTNSPLYPTHALDMYRRINFKNSSHQEAKLVWLYHKGKYPDTAVAPINGDRMDTRIENLRKSINNRVATTSESGVVGITQCKTGAYKGYWRVDVVHSTYDEVPADGKHTKGWTTRDTKIKTTRTRIHIGYFKDLDRAKEAHHLGTKEIASASNRALIDFRLNDLRMLLNSGVYSPYDRLAELLNAKKITPEEANVFASFFKYRNPNDTLRHVDGKFAVISSADAYKLMVGGSRAEAVAKTAIRIYE
jgi:hypothetical protein